MVLLDPTRSGNSIFNSLQVLIIHEDSEENHHLKEAQKFDPCYLQSHAFYPHFPIFLASTSHFGMVFIFSHSLFKIIFSYSPPKVCRKLKIQDIVEKYRRERSVSDFYVSLFFFFFFTNDAN